MKLNPKICTALMLALVSPALLAAKVCEVATDPLSFGTYDPFALLPNDNNAPVVVSCHETSLLGVFPIDVSYSITMSTGNSGSFNPRAMASASDTLNYNIYTDPTRLLVWGDDSGGTNDVAGTLTILLGGLSGEVSQTHTAYGRIFAEQNVDAGSYSDALIVTVSF